MLEVREAVPARKQARAEANLHEEGGLSVSAPGVVNSNQATGGSKRVAFTF